MVRSLLMLWTVRRHEFGGPEQQMESEFDLQARREWDESNVDHGRNARTCYFSVLNFTLARTRGARSSLPALTTTEYDPRLKLQRR